MKEGRLKILLRILCGVLIMMVNLYWIWHNAKLYWIYRDTSILYLSREPDWVLFVNIVWGCVGLVLGVKVVQRKVAPLRGIFFQLGIIIIWTLTDVFYSEVMEFLNLF